MTTNGPVELTAEISKTFENMARVAVLTAHASGLKAAAMLVADAADETGKASMALDEEVEAASKTATADDVDNFRRRSIELKIKSQVLAELNTKLMNRLKAVEVIVGQE